jgi:L-ribulose-5-phosphate 4-epimerase
MEWTGIFSQVFEDEKNPGALQDSFMPHEGISKINLKFSHASPLPFEQLREINAWRRILFQLHLIGQESERYGGFPYGNISRRLAPSKASPQQRPFLITGSRTSGLAELGVEHYAVVLACDLGENKIVAKGPIHPSAESITHGALYTVDDSIQFVMHVHSPDIWARARALGIPVTSAAAQYGSPELAAEVGSLLCDSVVRNRRIFAMDGHEDGIISFGPSAEDAFATLINHLAAAFQNSE